MSKFNECDWVHGRIAPSFYWDKLGQVTDVLGDGYYLVRWDGYTRKHAEHELEEA